MEVPDGWIARGKEAMNLNAFERESPMDGRRLNILFNYESLLIPHVARRSRDSLNLCFCRPATCIFTVRLSSL